MFEMTRHAYRSMPRDFNNDREWIMRDIFGCQYEATFDFNQGFVYDQKGNIGFYTHDCRQVFFKDNGHVAYEISW